jgi:hypothetical protein
MIGDGETSGDIDDSTSNSEKGCRSTIVVGDVERERSEITMIAEQKAP